MIVLCAWCEREGIRTVLKDGDANGPISHGICNHHQQEMLEQIVQLSEAKRAKNPKKRKRQRK